MVDVVFRMDTTHDEVVAVFPTITWSRDDLQCYAHNGQHGACKQGWYREFTRPAKPEEYADLLAELKRVGYQELTIKTRIAASCWNRVRI